MSVIQIIATFFVFVCIGFLLFIGYQIFSVRKKIIEAVNSKQPETSKPLTASVLDRLKKAAECTQEQNAIAAQHSMPSSNALHSKYKNQLASRFKQLEEEKIEILKSIVSDGFDPMVTCFNNSTQQDEQILLSEFLKIASGESPTQQVAEGPEIEPPPNVEPESIKKVVKNGKTFFLIEGGKTTTQ